MLIPGPWPSHSSAASSVLLQDVVPLAASPWQCGSFRPLGLTHRASLCPRGAVAGWGGRCPVESGHFCRSAENGEASAIFFFSPSGNGPVENSSGQLTADSVTGLQGPAGCASLCLPLSSKHVEFLLLQRRGECAACRGGGEPRAAAKGGAFGWSHEVCGLASLPFLSVLLCAWVCQGHWGCPLPKC